MDAQSEIVSVLNGVYAEAAVLCDENETMMVMVLDSFMHFMMGRAAADQAALIQLYKDFALFSTERFGHMKAKVDAALMNRR